MDIIWKQWHSLSSIRAGMGRVPLIRPLSEAELTDSLHACLARGERLFPIGNGTNLIGNDKESTDLVLVKTDGLKKMEYCGNDLFYVQSGLPLLSFIHKAMESNHGGLAALSGIPGSLGGALAMNAGANGSTISEFVQEMKGINLMNGVLWNWKAGEGGWGYRCSPVPPTVCITSAILKLSQSPAETEQTAIHAEAERRRRVTPKGCSCGSVFRNPSSAPAGKLLEEAGCKGLDRGVFSVSQQHANWIVNLSGQPGKAEDCLDLVSRMRKMVQDKFGIQLQLEWKVC